MLEYPEINMSDDEFIVLLKDKIKNKEPFCFTRFGDGFFGSYRVVREELKKYWLSGFGFKYPEEEVEGLNKIQEISIRAMHASDVIGLLTQSAHDKNFKFAPWPYKIDYWLFYIDEFKDKTGIDVNSEIIVDHQITRSRMMGDINNFKEIIGNTDIHIISCNVPGLESKKICDILGVNVNYTQTTNIMKYSERDYFLDKFKDIKEQVVLFGTGSMGKDFGTHLKNNYNKTCIDMGSTLDGWAGIISKPWFEKGSIQAYCVI